MSFRHAAIGRRVVQQAGGIGENGLDVGADQPGRSGGDTFGALRVFAHHEHGLAERRRLFLHAAAVGQHQVAALLQIEERQVVLRLDQVDVRHVADLGRHHAPYVGVGVDGVDDLDVAARRKPLERGADALDAAVEILTPVPGDEDQLLACVEEGEARREFAVHFLVGIDPTREVQQRVDHRVAGDEDRVGVLALADQVVARFRRRREVPGGDVAGDQPVQLLGEGAVDSVAAQPRLDMRHRDALVEGGERRGHRRGRVALHHDDVGPGLLEHRFHAFEHPGGDVEQCLAVRHDVEVVVDRYAGERDHAVHHLAMLGGDADFGVDVRALDRRPGDREAFQRFGARAEHDQQLQPARSLG